MVRSCIGSTHTLLKSLKYLIMRQYSRQWNKIQYPEKDGWKTGNSALLSGFPSYRIMECGMENICMVLFMHWKKLWRTMHKNVIAIQGFCAIHKRKQGLLWNCSQPRKAAIKLNQHMRGADIQYKNTSIMTDLINAAALGSVKISSCQHQHCRGPYQIWMPWMKLWEGLNWPACWWMNMTHLIYTNQLAAGFV